MHRRGVVVTRRSLGALSVVATVLAVLSNPAGAIINGVADNGHHPNVGTIIWRDGAGDLFRSCSGTLISPTVFLSAAHCVVPFPGFENEVVVGVSFAEHTPDAITDYVPGTAHAHPKFVWSKGQGWGATGPGNEEFDVGVVVLDEPYLDEAPARLPTLNLLDAMKASKKLASTTFVTVGYGATDPLQPGASHCCGPRGDRRYATESYRSLGSELLDTNQNPSTGFGGGCYGDSGGPHFIDTTDVIAAITFIGDIPCVSNARSYRVDTPTARAFLGSYVTLP